MPPHPSQYHRTDYCYPYPNALLQITSESMKVHQIFPLSRDSLRKHSSAISTVKYSKLLSFQEQWGQLSPFKISDPLGVENSVFQHQYLMDSTYLPSISTLKRMSFEPRSHPCSTKLQALVIPEKAQEKLPHTSPQKEQMHTKTVFNHNKLCIYYAIRKSFTDSSLIVLSIQGIVTNCKGIAMEAFSQTMNVKRNVTHLVTLRDARCARKRVHTMS